MEMNASLKELLMLVIIDIIALSLEPTVRAAVVAAIAGGNVTGISDTLLGIVTWVYVICIMGANLAVLYKLFKG